MYLSKLAANYAAAVERVTKASARTNELREALKDAESEHQAAWEDRAYAEEMLLCAAAGVQA